MERLGISQSFNFNVYMKQENPKNLTFSMPVSFALCKTSSKSSKSQKAFCTILLPYNNDNDNNVQNLNNVISLFLMSPFLHSHVYFMLLHLYLFLSGITSFSQSFHSGLQVSDRMIIQPILIILSVSVI